jgi:hypothetical protein
MSEELKNGKWSEWISNEGNSNRAYPLNYIGSHWVRCEVGFRDGVGNDDGLIAYWNWSDIGVGYSIVKYRYWIPDTETQTEPNTDTLTEKDSYVNIWTDKDEEVLKELLAKKGKAEFENKAKLAGLLIKINHQSLYVESYKVDTMIEHADELIDALQPYRKQK